MTASTTYQPKINVADIPGAIAAAKGRTGRAAGAIVADWALCGVYYQDLQASVQQISAAALDDRKATERKIKALTIASRPATIEVAGFVIRRTDPVADADALHTALLGRLESATAQLKALRERQDAVNTLAGEFLAELERAGMSKAEAQVWLKSGTVTRVAKAAAA